MSLLFIDGFDHYATAQAALKWTAVSGVTILPTGGRRSSGAMQISTGTATRVLPANEASFVMGAAVKLTNTALNNTRIFHVFDTTTTQLSVGVNPDMTISLYRGSSTVIATSAAAVPMDAFFYLEFKATISSSISADTCIVRLNGVNIINLAAGTSTRQTTNNYITRFGLGPSGSNLFNTIFDDFYICNQSGSLNNNFLGDSRIDTIMPTSDGFYTNGIPSTGTAHYACVDEIPPNSTDYIYMDAVGQRDSYGFADIPPLSAATLYGVQAVATWLKDDAGSRSAAIFARSSSTNADGTAAGLSTSQTMVPQIYETDPATSAAWTQSAVNAAEFGTTVTA